MKASELPRLAASVLKLAARSMFELFFRHLKATSGGKSRI